MDCPECGSPLKKVVGAEKYFCENKNCIIIYVCHPYEPRMRIAYTSYARYKSNEPLRKSSGQKPVKQRFKLF